MFPRNGNTVLKSGLSFINLLSLLVKKCLTNLLLHVPEVSPITWTNPPTLVRPRAPEPCLLLSFSMQKKNLDLRSEHDEAPALAASVLWKLSEYQDFVAPLLKAEAAKACADAVEDLGPPLLGPLHHWLQVSVQVGLIPRSFLGGMHLLPSEAMFSDRLHSPSEKLTVSMIPFSVTINMNSVLVFGLYTVVARRNLGGLGYAILFFFEVSRGSGVGY